MKFAFISATFSKYDSLFSFCFVFIFQPVVDKVWMQIKFISVRKLEKLNLMNISPNVLENATKNCLLLCFLGFFKIIYVLLFATIYKINT